MNPFLPLIGYLFGKSIRDANKGLWTETKGGGSSKTDWAFWYAGIVAMIIFASELFLGDVMWLSVSMKLPMSASTAIIVSPHVSFIAILLVDQYTKFEMSNRTTDSLLIESVSACAAAGLVWFGYHIGALEHLHWGWKFAIDLAPSAVFVLSSRIAALFKLPAPRSVNLY
jgi:hypothetical protein